LKTNSGKKGVGMPVLRNPQYYFKEGFCWNNVLNPQARLLKTKMKFPSVNDVGSMSLYSTISTLPNFYFVTLLNSDLIFDYYREYINCSVNIQINDVRQIPVVIPTQKTLDKLKYLFDRAIELKKSVADGSATEEEISVELERVEMLLNEHINLLYCV